MPDLISVLLADKKFIITIDKTSDGRLKRQYIIIRQRNVSMELTAADLIKIYRLN